MIQSQLFQWLLEGNNDELRKVNINAIDLNFYEPVDELTFLDERVTPLVYCASLGTSNQKCREDGVGKAAARQSTDRRRPLDAGKWADPTHRSLFRVQLLDGQALAG